MNKKTDKTMKKICLATGLVLLIVLPSLAREKYEEKFTRTEPLVRDGRVYLSNVSGDVVIGTWKENQVKIEAVKISQAGTMEKAKENAARVAIEVRQESGSVIIETNYPKSQSFWSLSRDSLNVSVNYRLLVPETASVEVRSVSGDIRVEGVGGKAKLKSTSGDIEVRRVSALEASLVSGDVIVEDVRGDFEVKTVSGDIKARAVTGSISAESVSGDVELAGISQARTVSARSVSGDISYDGAVYDGGRYEFKTTSGDIKVILPADASFEFEAKTFSGTIDSSFEIVLVGRISPKEIRGTVGKGGASLSLSSFSGSVGLKKR